MVPRIHADVEFGRGMIAPLKQLGLADPIVGIAPKCGNRTRYGVLRIVTIVLDDGQVRSYDQ